MLKDQQLRTDKTGQAMGPHDPKSWPVSWSYLVNFLNTLMPRVTTRIAPTTGIATGTIAEIAPIMSLAVVDRAAVRDSVTVPIAFSICVFLSYQLVTQRAKADIIKFIKFAISPTNRPKAKPDIITRELSSMYFPQNSETN